MATLKFNPKDSVIILEVEISARFLTTAFLVLDTGASNMVLSWKLVNTIGLAIAPRKTTQTTTVSTVETVPKIKIQKVSVLGKSARNVEAIVKDLPPEAGVDGLLGLSFLRHLN